MELSERVLVLGDVSTACCGIRPDFSKEASMGISFLLAVLRIGSLVVAPWIGAEWFNLGDGGRGVVVAVEN